MDERYVVVINRQGQAFRTDAFPFKAVDLQKKLVVNSFTTREKAQAECDRLNAEAEKPHETTGETSRSNKAMLKRIEDLEKAVPHIRKRDDYLSHRISECETRLDNIPAALDKLKPEPEVKWHWVNDVYTNFLYRGKVNYSSIEYADDAIRLAAILNAGEDAYRWLDDAAAYIGSLKDSSSMIQYRKLCAKIADMKKVFNSERTNNLED